MWTIRKHRSVALALQGGGAHGAFSAGVLDRLLEKGFAPSRISGVSSGALIATALVQGWAANGAEGARAAVKRLWEKIAEAQAANGMDNGALGRWLGADLADNPFWQTVSAAFKLFAPDQINPLGHNPLRPLIAGFLDRNLLSSAAAPRLIVGATDVETGAPVLFDNADITVEVLLASTCLPFLFPSVEINGRLLWDGAYSANPPLAPLLEADLPDELVLIRAQPRRHPGRPGTPDEIFNRQVEIAFQRALEAELARLPPSIRLTDYEPDEELAALPISSRLHAEGNFIRALFIAGREAAHRREASAPGAAAA